MKFLVAAVLCLALAPATGAAALCSYDGVLYAHPALAREYVDADRVVRARVLSVTDSWRQPGWKDDEAPWTVYRLAVIEDFKAHPGREITYFTYRDSGAFYLDEVGDEFLLFLEPKGFPDPDAPPVAHGAMNANYCGNSAPWGEVSAEQRRQLTGLRAAAARR